MGATPFFFFLGSRFLPINNFKWAVKGLVAFVLVMSTGCSMTQPTSMEVSGLNGSEDGEKEQSSLVFEAPATPQQLSSVEEGVSIELRANSDQVDLVVRSQTGDEVDYQIDRSYDPQKIKVSLLNEKSKITEPRIIVPTNTDLVSEAKLSNDAEGKSIIEIALNDQRQVSYESEPVAGNLYVTISAQDSIANVNEVMAENADINSDKTTKELSVAETLPAEDKLVNDQLVKNEELIKPEDITVAAADIAQPTSTRPILKSLNFQNSQDLGQYVVAEMNSAGVYSLQKTAPSEYVLRLEGATFRPEQIQTLLAPPSSNTIRSVRPVIDGNDTLLRVFANPAINLEAESKGSNIILKPATSGLDGQFLARRDDIRAQAELEGAEEGEAVEVSDTSSSDGEIQNLTDIEGEISALLDDSPSYSGRKISLDLQDTDIDNALRIIAEVSNLNIIASDDVQGKITLRLIDVPWDQALDVILKTNGLDKVLEGNVMRIAPIEKLRKERESLKLAKEAEEELEPLVVKYIRISYAKAAEMRPLVESVLSERGSVTYDERTNQLIVKDIRRGVKNVAELVARLDLRTPQVLLETQIVEAERTFFRTLGSQLGFTSIQSPETGNPTGYNFPNSVTVGGSAGADGSASSFPAAISDIGGSAVSLLLDSADGTKSLDYRLSALETEGQVRIVSRPSVATTNNKQAVIKSVEKVRVKTPSGGVSVGVGSGANASGTGGTATEAIEIGIVLEVTPQASPDYFVLLDINAKSSTFGAERVDDIPSERERSATSSVLVSSGQTFAMGGIYKITDNDSVEGVPFLKDVPFLGHMFRRNTIRNSDEELIFFITPRIIEGSFDDAAMKLSS